MKKTNFSLNITPKITKEMSIKALKEINKTNTERKLEFNFNGFDAFSEALQSLTCFGFTPNLLLYSFRNVVELYVYNLDPELVRHDMNLYRQLANSEHKLRIVKFEYNKQGKKVNSKHKDMFELAALFPPALFQSYLMDMRFSTRDLRPYTVYLTANRSQFSHFYAHLKANDKVEHILCSKLIIEKHQSYIHRLRLTAAMKYGKQDEFTKRYISHEQTEWYNCNDEDDRYPKDQLVYAKKILIL